MELLIRGLICFVCLWCYKRFVLCTRTNNKIEMRIDIPFLLVIAFALQIITHSIIFRLAKIVGMSNIIQELLIVLCVGIEYTIIYIFIKKFIKDNEDKLLYNTVSLTFLVTLCIYIVCGFITRENFVIAFLAALAVSFMCVKIKADNIEVAQKRVWKNRLKFSLPVALLTGMTFYIYLPSELYLGNPNNFRVGYWAFIWPLIVKCIFCVSIYLYITLFCMSKRHYYICNSFFMFFVLLSNIQNMFLNGKLKSMDGTIQEWRIQTISFNLMIWIIIFIGCLAVSIWNKKAVRNVLKVIGYFGVAIQVIALIILLIITLPTIKFDNYILTTDNYFKVSDKENVFVFVLDWFDNQIMEQICEEDEDFLEPLDGFTHFANTTSKYAFTDMSLVYLLTGVEWEYDQLESEYAIKANEKSDFLEKIDEADYMINIYTGENYIGQTERALVENGQYIERGLNIKEQVRLMEKTARYKTSPFLFKDNFLYTDNDIWDIVLIKGNVDNHNIYNDVPFAKSLHEDGISIVAGKAGMFKLYHLHGAHTPYTMNDKFERVESNMLAQAKGSMKIVFDFIEDLKKNGLYENATIIITADHGQNYFDRPKMAEELDLKLISSPIMFVKERGSYGTELQISEAPVSHEEVLPTILKAITGDTQRYGKTFDEVGGQEDRVREFIYGRHDDIPFVKYTITGDVMDINNWSEPLVVIE